MNASLVVLSAVLAAATPPASHPSEPVSMPSCLLVLIDEAQVPAEEMGKLLEMNVKRGQQVKAGEVLAQIDNKRAEMALTVADVKHKVAFKEANNDIHVRYSQSSTEVSKAEYEIAEEANRRVKDTVPLAEMRRLWLKWKEAYLSIEQAHTNLEIAILNTGVSRAELEAAEENLKRHQITSPLDGVVIELHRHKGEWVKPGDPVLHVVGMKKLRVQGYLNSNDVLPKEITTGQKVSVIVELARGRTLPVKGTIEYVSQQVGAGGQFRVHAEVTNWEEEVIDSRGGRQKYWALRPGLTATMTISPR